MRRSGEVVDTAIVPKKHEIPAGTLRSILSQAHINPDDWDKLQARTRPPNVVGWWRLLRW